jgi:integrase
VCLAHLLKACRPDALGLRDAALLRIAYDTAARRSELVAIEVAHIEGPDAEGAGVLHIPSSKTDRAGRRRGLFEPGDDGGDRALAQSGRHCPRPLLRRVVTHFDGSIDRIRGDRLHPNSITPIVQRLIRRAWEQGLLGAMGEAELERWLKAVSSHSIRVGVAQDNFAAGEGLPAIMQAYRWRDARTVLRYGAKLAAKSGASARLARRFSDEVGSSHGANSASDSACGGKAHLQWTKAEQRAGLAQIARQPRSDVRLLVRTGSRNLASGNFCAIPRQNWRSG